jgi:nitrate reductase gamma subunit
MALLVTAIAIFIAGNLYRAIRILRMPTHLRWELYPLPRGPRARQSYGGSYFEESEWWTKPAETGRVAELRYIFEEVLFLKGVWKNFRALWLWSWLLHVGLYLLVGAAALGTLMQFTADSLNDARGWAMAALQTLSWAAMCAGLAGTLGLLVLRATSPRLRPYSSRGVFLNLTVIAVLFGTGLAGMIFDSAMVADMIGVLGALLGRSEAPSLSAIATVHLGVVAIFLAYFPFTHMTHAFMKFFTYHSVRWDDAPAATDSAAQRSVAESLGRVVSWTAPHIAADGTKTWREVVSAERTRSDSKP